MVLDRDNKKMKMENGKNMGTGARKGSNVDLEKLKMRENGLLMINDIFGPEIGVINALMRKWRNQCNGDAAPLEFSEYEMESWIRREIAAFGYSKIPAATAFSRNADGIWAKEYKIVRS
jgi:hypothetical protein